MKTLKLAGIDYQLFNIIQNQDVKIIKEILMSTSYFYDYEIDVATDIATEYLEKDDHNGYYFQKLTHNGKMIAFTTYGEIPCTKGSFDLYWIAVHSDFRGKGLGLALLYETEKHIKTLSGRKIYIETSSTEKYMPTQKFYFKAGYILEAVLKDYYHINDNKLMYSKDI